MKKTLIILRDRHNIHAEMQKVRRYDDERVKQDGERDIAWLLSFLPSYLPSALGDLDQVGGVVDFAGWPVIISR